MAKDDPLGVMGSIMAAAQVGQGAAEKAQEKAVNIGRQNITNLLQRQTSVLAQGIMHYNTELAASSAGLMQVISSSSKILEKAAKEEAAKATSSWSLPDPAQSRLNAQKNLAEKDYQKVERKRARAIKEAVEDAAMLLENGVHKLSMRVGDVTELVDQAKSNLGKKTESVPVPPTALAQKSTLDLKTAGTALSKADDQVDKDRVSAKAHLNKVLAQSEKDLASGTAGILAALDHAEQEEFKTIHGGDLPVITPPAPVKRSFRHHRQDKK